MKSSSYPFVLLLGLLVVVPLFAADFWEEKEFAEWSAEECNKLLRKSPWAFSNSFRNTANLGSTITGERETGEIIEFRLLTAKPVRMAFGRMQLLSRQRDGALQEQIMSYINSPPGDEIMIQISYRNLLGVSPYIQNLASFFARATLATFANNTLLASSDGVNVPISAYLPMNSQRPNPVFVFSRFAQDGRPHFSGREKSLSLRSVFETGQVDRKRYKIYVRMKPRDMVFQGKFEI